jgi:IS30 family transposase
MPELNNHGKPWTADEERALRQFLDAKTPNRVISTRLGRTPTAIKNKLKEMREREMGRASPYACQRK